MGQCEMSTALALTPTIVIAYMPKEKKCSRAISSRNPGEPNDVVKVLLQFLEKINLVDFDRHKRASALLRYKRMRVVAMWK